MSVLGQQIKKHRMKKGLTQEQLGQLIGVTTQAVSKWECGGTPDAELLPKLSDVLSISIDALFGREEQNFLLSLAQKIGSMSKEKAYHFAFSTCWAIQMGLLQEPDVADPYLDAFIDYTHLDKDGIPHFGRIMQDDGVSVARIAPDFHHFFLMLEPKSGIAQQLVESERLRRVFSLFADETMMKIIFYLYTRLNTPIATSLISKKTDLPIEKVDQCMNELCEHGLAKRTVIATAEGEIYSYMFNQESAVIPLLCFADEIARQDAENFIRCFTRTKPLF